MNVPRWVKSEVEYGEELVRSAIAGGRSGRDHALGHQPAQCVLERSARGAAPWVAVGASLSLLAAYWGAKRRFSSATAIASMLAGAAVGLVTTVAFSTRHVTQETVRGAMKSVGAARDAHWLASHPIDYA
jgi:hypothetical protein